jgi:hypothetical protein
VLKVEVMRYLILNLTLTSDVESGKSSSTASAVNEAMMIAMKKAGKKLIIVV